MIKNILLAFAEFERDIIVERTQEGKVVAKQNPNYREGIKPTYTKAKLDHDMKLKETHSFSQMEEITGISMSILKRESRKRK